MRDYTCGGKLNLLNARIRDWREGKGFETHWGIMGDKLLLVVSELCETFEAYRDLRKSTIAKLRLAPAHTPPMTEEETEAFANFKEELADTYIRLGDLCASCCIDIESAINNKMAVNEKRPTKHGRQR